MTQIAALVATRGRPDNIDRLLEAAEATGTQHVTWYIALDQDDEQNYPRRDGIHYHVQPRAQLTVKTNALAEFTWDTHPILAQFDDDQWPRTQGWDQAVIQAMQHLDGGLVYTNDGWMGAQTPVCPFWPAAYAKRLGWFLPPSMHHLFVDNTLKELGQALGRITYLHDILIEHMHPIVQKSAWDDSYAESNSGEMWGHDERAFHEYHDSQQFRDDVTALADTSWLALSEAA